MRVCEAVLFQSLKLSAPTWFPPSRVSPRVSQENLGSFQRCSSDFSEMLRDVSDIFGDCPEFFKEFSNISRVVSKDASKLLQYSPARPSGYYFLCFCSGFSMRMWINRICVLTWGAKFRLSSSCFGDFLNMFQRVPRVFSEIFRIPRPDPVANIPSGFSRFPTRMWIDRFLCSLAVTNEVVAVLCKRSQLLMCDIFAGQKECARVTWRCW